MSGVVAREALPEHGPLLVDLFRRAGVPCHCRYWHFAGNTNAWLDRSAHHEDQNRDEMLAALTAQSPEMSGIVATLDDRAVGWMKLAPALALPKLYGQRLYKALPCFGGDRDGVFAIGCFLVDPDARRTGVARALLAGGIELAKRRGGRMIEAFPRRAEGMSDAEAFTGAFSLYVREGFEVVNDFGPYPVMRLTL